MFIKIFIVIVMLAIVASLGSGLVFLIRNPNNSNRTVKALTWRIALSLGLFIFLFIAFQQHWITPHSLLGTH